ncbi:MAG: hypothetical protein AAGD14_11910 [Planctomycetota bacterium]
MARQSFEELLESLRGRVPAEPDHPERADALRLLRAGRAVAEEQPVPRAWLRRAEGLLAKQRPSRFRLVFDTWFQPQPALRRAPMSDAPRFLRFEGPNALDLEITAVPGGVRVMGQLEPPGGHDAVQLRVGDIEIEVPVAPDGTFRTKKLPRGSATMRIGAARIEDIPL